MLCSLFFLLVNQVLIIIIVLICQVYSQTIEFDSALHDAVYINVSVILLHVCTYLLCMHTCIRTYGTLHKKLCEDCEYKCKVLRIVMWQSIGEAMFTKTSPKLRAKCTSINSNLTIITWTNPMPYAFN